MHSKRFLVAAFMTVASSAAAQPVRRGGPPMGPAGGGDMATILIDARRELNLSPKQLLALDSIERTDYAQRRKAIETMRGRRDSLCANRSPCELTSEERQRFVGGPAGIEKRIGDRLRADSAGRTRIMGMLDTTQRRLADRLTYRQHVDRMERRIDGPSRGAMHQGWMPDYGPRHRDSWGRDGRGDWDGPRGFGDSRDRMMRPDGPRDNDLNDPRHDRRMGPGPTRGWDDRGGSAPRRRPPGETGTLPDTTGR